MANTPFNPTGPTVRVTGAVSGSLPVPVQAVSAPGNVKANQYVITNEGSVVAWVSWGPNATAATANCVQPVTGQPGQNVYSMLNGSQVTLTLGTDFFFCAITASSTAIIDITPGYGQ